MSYRYPLKSCLAFRIFPRNIQHIGLNFAWRHFQSGEKIGTGTRNLSIDPGPVRYQYVLFRPDGIDLIKPDVSL